MSTDPDVADPCASCGGKCCSFREMAISYRSLDAGERYDSHFLHDDTHDQLVFDDGTVPEMQWYILTYPNGARKIAFECGHRRDDGLCGAYDKRPSMCRTFECPALDDDSDTTLDEFLDSLDYVDGVRDDIDVRDVTDRVQGILKRRADEENWADDG